MIIAHNVLFVLYASLLVFGVSGNCAVLVIVGRLLFRQRHVLPSRKTEITVHLYYYVLALSAADLLVLSVIPATVIELWNEYWLLGVIMCKLHWITENVNKIISISILTALSVDRYLAVCHPHKFHWIRTGKAVLVILTVFVIVAVLLMLPALIYSGVFLLPIAKAQNDTYILVPKCSMDIFMPRALFKTFVYYLFIYAFLIPVFVIGFCYSKLALFIGKHFKNPRTSKSRLLNYFRIRKDPSYCDSMADLNFDMDSTIEGDHHHSPINSPSSPVSSTRSDRNVRNRRKAYRSIISVVIFHFICWTPFWLSILVPLIYGNYEIGQHDQTIVTITLFLHLLPYINSSANWIFYVFMNKEIRKTAARRDRKQEKPLILKNETRTRMPARGKNRESPRDMLPLKTLTHS